MLSDEELFIKYRSGEGSGFEELLKRYQAPLFTVILRLVRDRGEAEDLFQETWVRVVRNRERFNVELKFSPWLYSIATNLCRDHLRRRVRNPVECRDEVPEGGDSKSPEQESWRREISAALAQAVDRLPDEQREVFLLRESAGLEFKEIAQMQNRNLNTVLGRMHLAVKKLRLELAGLREGLE